MKLLIYPSNLEGCISVPSSKSLTHRALICAALAKGKSIIYEPLLCDDIEESISVLKKIGADFIFYENKIIVLGTSLQPSKNISLEISESASTLRFLVPMLSIFYDEIIIKSSSRLIERINTKDLASLSGLSFTFEDKLIKVKGSLLDENYYLKTNLTTQWLSGMLIALPYLPHGTTLKYDGSFSLNSYLNLTLNICRTFGIDHQTKGNEISLEKEGFYLPNSYKIEGDYSAAANWLAASIFNPKLKIGNLNPASLQADFKIFQYLEKMGIKYHYDNGDYSFFSGELSGAVLDISRTPDLFPILASLGAVCKGTLQIRGIEKLKYKESNRVNLMVEGLKSLGADVELRNDEVIINGKAFLDGEGEIITQNDHRIIMAFVILSGKVKNPFILSSFVGVSKSYPDFFDKYQNLGGKVEVLK